MLRSGDRLERGVLGEGRAGFLDFGQIGMGEQIFDAPAVAEDGADFLRLVGVAGGEENFLGHEAKRGLLC